MLAHNFRFTPPRFTQNRGGVNVWTWLLTPMHPSGAKLYIHGKIECLLGSTPTNPIYICHLFRVFCIYMVRKGGRLSACVGMANLYQAWKKNATDTHSQTLVILGFLNAVPYEWANERIVMRLISANLATQLGGNIFEFWGNSLWWRVARLASSTA